jgi:hypothetical protein
MCIYDIYGPCSFPHGRCFTLMAQMFAIGSLITSSMALTSCFYVSVQPIPKEGEVELPKEGFGWLARQIKIKEPPSYGKECVFYSNEERSMYFDSMWNSGYSMALIAVLLGSIIMCIVLCTCCVAFKEKTFDTLFYLCIICFLCQALSFLSWGSELCTGELEMECTWAAGTGMNMTASMMWVWAANMIKSFPEALPPPKRRKRGRKRDQDRDDDDDADAADGDVYLTDNGDGYQDEYDDEGDGYYDDDGNWVEGGENSGQMEDEDDDGYYDDDGNWIANEDGEYEGYDGYDDVDGGAEYNDGGVYDDDDYDDDGGDGKQQQQQQQDGGGDGYNDYEDEDDNNNWAEEESDNNNNNNININNYGSESESEEEYEDENDEDSRKII